MQTRTITIWIKLSAILLLSFSSPSWSTPSNGIDWLKMMAQSGEMLNYSGKFVVSRNRELSTLRVSHMGSAMGGVQKLSSVDGKRREIVSGKDAVSCLLSDLNMGIKEARQSTVDQYFPMNFNGNMQLLRQNYAVHIDGSSRVANRDCQQIAIKPKDQLRYGYLLCIDKENYLLLSSDLIDVSGVALESYRFVDIQFDQVTEQTLAPEVEAMSLNWMDDEGHDDNTSQQVTWVLNEGSPNFEINHSLTRYAPALQSQIHHIVLSDGLVNVSAFVVSAVGDGKDIVKELSMGALNSYTRMVDGYKLTVLGEVPKATANLLADSFHIQ